MQSWRELLLSGSLLVILSSTFGQPSVGTISGTVLTEQGVPVADAHVSARVMDGEKALTVLGAHTDKSGKFVFNALAWGTYRISAEKQEAGYLTTAPGGFISRPLIIANLTSASPVFNTEIRFDPKAGVLSGWVVDATNGKSLRAHLSLAPVSGGRWWSTTGTAGDYEFRLQIPSNTDLLFGACAEGYKKWAFSGPVHLNPDFELKLQIKLQPSNDPADAVCLFGKF